jgi:hypothetical protein
MSSTSFNFGTKKTRSNQHTRKLYTTLLGWTELVEEMVMYLCIGNFIFHFNFIKFMPNQCLSRWLARYVILILTADADGSVHLHECFVRNSICCLNRSTCRRLTLNTELYIAHKISSHYTPRQSGSLWYASPSR